MDILLATALNIGVGYKVYALLAPQSKIKPYAVYSVVTDKRDNHSNGQGDLKEVRYEIKVYADSRVRAEEVGADIETNIRASLDFESYIYQSFTDLDDEKDSKSFRYILDFKLWK